MRVQIIYSFKAEIHRGAGEIVDYSKTSTSTPGMFTSLQDIQAYIKECEQRHLDLDNEEVWSKAYSPHEKTTKAQDNFEEKVIFRHVQRRLEPSNEPLMSCGPLPDWSRGKRCIYAIDTFEDNLYVWRFLAIHKGHAVDEKINCPKETVRQPRL